MAINKTAPPKSKTELAKELGISRQINYYNHRRIHTSLKCPPAVFAERAKKNMETTKIQESDYIKVINRQETGMRLCV